MSTAIGCWSPPLPDGRFDKSALIERALALTGIGAWACELADSSLCWTAGVYDLFGLPADAVVDRRETAAMYAEESWQMMETLRDRAIAGGGRFSLDAEIVRTDGAHRWMRLTGDVVVEDGRARRLYGLKQDITEEKQRREAVRRLAEHDALTGLASRAVFQSRFLDAPAGGSGLAPLGALILFDVDGFKRVNDRYGHATGDAYAYDAEAMFAVADAALYAAKTAGRNTFRVGVPGGEAKRVMRLVK